MFERKQQYDAMGFPVPADFETKLGEEGSSEAPGRGAQSRASKPRAGMRAMRVMFILLFLLMGAAALYRSELKDEISSTLAEWQWDQARQSLLANDVEGALAHMDRAIALAPDNANYLHDRGIVRLRRHDLAGCVSDLSRAIELNPRNRTAFVARSQAYQRLERHEEAIADANSYVQLSGPGSAEALNQRAYTRAIAKREIKEGLEDIQEALKLIGWQEAPSAQLPSDWNEKIQLVSDHDTLSAFLDTRGLLLHLNKEQEPALVDLELAIQLTEKIKSDFNRQLLKDRFEERRLRRHEAWLRARTTLMIQKLNQNLAVMYFHRYLVNEALGELTKAEEDERLAKDLGYNPAAGVY